MTKIRSTTGCAACKRKKCDEGKPRCERCISSGGSCSYEYLDHPTTLPHLVQRTRPAPRSELTKASRDALASLELLTPSFSTPSASVGLVGSSDNTLTTAQGNGIDQSFSLTMSPGCTVDLSALFTPPLPTDPHLCHSASPGISRAPVEITQNPVAPTPGLGTGLGGPTQLDDGEPKFIEDYDPEGIHVVLCITPTMDKNLKENALPFVLQSYSQWAIVSIFACSEPPGQPLNLANMLLDPGLNLRHFVSVDIMTSVTTGRPTCFKYEIAFSAEPCERMFQLQENCGLHWLHGLPDQFIMILAWINSLCEIPGEGVDAELITWIETEILQVKITLDQSEDPALRIGRTAVREAWRNATLIYLYMVLCKANASDHRSTRPKELYATRLRNKTRTYS
ncbi:hypothetical protein RSAG8_08019, partial [Rhizoctonia solani AG-8 WAC10335]